MTQEINFSFPKEVNFIKDFSDNLKVVVIVGESSDNKTPLPEDALNIMIYFQILFGTVIFYVPNILS